MDIHIRNVEENCILDIVGEIDLYNSYRLKDTVSAVIEKKVSLFIFNLKKVSYVDSSGIGAFLWINATLAKKEIPFRIINVPPFVLKVMELTRLVGFLPVELPGKGPTIVPVGDGKAVGQRAQASRQTKGQQMQVS